MSTQPDQLSQCSATRTVQYSIEGTDVSIDGDATAPLHTPSHPHTPSNQLDSSQHHSHQTTRATYETLAVEVRLNHILPNLGHADLENMRLTWRQGLIESNDHMKTYELLNCLDGRGISDYSPFSLKRRESTRSKALNPVKTLALVTNPNHSRPDRFEELSKQIHTDTSTCPLEMLFIHLEAPTKHPTDPAGTPFVSHPIDLLNRFRGRAFVFSGNASRDSCAWVSSQIFSWPYKSEFELGIQIVNGETQRSCMFGFTASGGPELAHIIRDTKPDEQIVHSLDYLLTRIIELRTDQRVTVALAPPNTQADSNELRKKLVGSRRASYLAGDYTEEVLSQLTIRLVDRHERSSFGSALRWHETITDTVSRYRQDPGTGPAQSSEKEE